jgi:hypothetical protein
VLRWAHSGWSRWERHGHLNTAAGQYQLHGLHCLVRPRRQVPRRAKGVPQGAGKPLKVQPVSTDWTVRTNLPEKPSSHLHHKTPTGKHELRNDRFCTVHKNAYNSKTVEPKVLTFHQNVAETLRHKFGIQRLS